MGFSETLGFRERFLEGVFRSRSLAGALQIRRAARVEKRRLSPGLVVEQTCFVSIISILIYNSVMVVHSAEFIIYTSTWLMLNFESPPSLNYFLAFHARSATKN